MKILPIKNSIMNSITYILFSENTDECVLIDCGEYETLQPVLNNIGKKIKAVLLTHGHSDHIYGLKKLLKIQPNIPIGTNAEGHDEIKDSRKNLSLYHSNPFTIEGYRSIELSDNQILHFEGIGDIEVIATPGHDSSCLTYKIEKNLFTGDSYIPGIKVFTKFPRGNKEQAMMSIKRLSTMEANGYIIHCGHHSCENI